MLNGIRLVAAGEHGSPVLLLHGIGGSSESFTDHLTAWSGRHQVFAWDAPGYGESRDPADTIGMSGYADVVAGVLDGLGLSSVHLVGVSWGGVIATRAALLHPDRVRSLVLADSTRGSGTSPESAARMRARVGELSRLGAAEFARRRGPRLTAPGADPAVTRRVASIMSGLRIPGYTAAVRSMADTDHGDALAHISVPTLVVVGEYDRVTGVPESHLLAAGIPGARLKIVPGGHAAHQEHPEPFSRAVLPFLSSVDHALPVGGA